MVDVIKKFAKKNKIIWALLMGVLSTLMLLSFGIFLMNIKNEPNNYSEDSNIFLILLKIIFSSILLCLFFTLFTYNKTLGVLFRVINIIVFFVVFFIIYIYSSENMQYLDEKIHFISVKQWTENGYEPPEEEISDKFLGIIFICLSFVNIFLLNLLPSNLLHKKK